MNLQTLNGYLNTKNPSQKQLKEFDKSNLKSQELVDGNNMTENDLQMS